MNIAVLSGKGGTGKTTVSTNLALMLGANYIDCDVEEPNGFLFLKPEKLDERKVNVDIPIIEQDKCTLCGECVKVCRFNALAKTKKNIMVFDKLCHSCGACEIVCPTGALQYQKKTIGIIEEGKKGDTICKRGLLNIGEPMAVPILRELLKDLPQGTNFLDSPPGTSCNVVNTLHRADAAILVTEPTAFGLHDLKMAVELVKEFNIPFGLVVNKYNENNRILDKYINEEKINVLGHIPYNKEAAKKYSKGDMLIDLKGYREAFLNIVEKMKEALL